MIWGAEEITEMNLFFPGNPFRIKISWRVPLKIYYFPEKGLRLFFSQFPQAPPRSLLAVPLKNLFLNFERQSSNRIIHSEYP